MMSKRRDEKSRVVGSDTPVVVCHTSCMCHTSCSPTRSFNCKELSGTSSARQPETYSSQVSYHNNNIFDFVRLLSGLSAFSMLDFLFVGKCSVFLGFGLQLNCERKPTCQAWRLWQILLSEKFDARSGQRIVSEYTLKIFIQRWYDTHVYSQCYLLGTKSVYFELIKVF